RRRLGGGRAPDAGLGVLYHGPPHPAPAGGRAALQGAVDAAGGHVRGPRLPPRPAAGRAQAGAETAPAGLDSGRGRAADAAPGGRGGREAPAPSASLRGGGVRLGADSGRLLGSARIGRLALHAGRFPLVNPAAFVYQGDSIWITSSRFAAKFALARRDPRASFLVTGSGRSVELQGLLEPYDLRSVAGLL